ncbi:GNAT family N-acetyltransferase [Intrasporangium sp. YIM S08009]|uniref:GNAT family N-acetyltransferase n=1 Tax=Intrasporangium zincisolvens TaxID=3080018 RepID=UPI002B054CD0|nr:GNAT family N-acetyltransferase [Intrasporangium sp. YIM S08009]
MTIELHTPGPDRLPAVVEAMRAWQHDGGPVQLHPGDLGWNQGFGAEAMAVALRVWSRDGEVVAVGLLDEPTLLRLAVVPAGWRDEETADRLVADVSTPGRGVLPEGSVAVEARFGGTFRERLLADGWVPDEPWAPLVRSLARPVEDCGLRVEIVDPSDDEAIAARVAVQRAAFARSTFTAERWHAMAAGPAYADAHCLVVHGADGTAVGAATVWSAGAGRPGLIESLGVHQEHRGRGHGTAVTVAAASVLRGMGSSSVMVCTPSANVGGIATYVRAGFTRMDDSRDLRRPA